jgi:hypothetical protein
MPRFSYSLLLSIAFASTAVMADDPLQRITGSRVVEGWEKKSSAGQKPRSKDIFAETSGFQRLFRDDESASLLDGWFALSDPTYLTLKRTFETTKYYFAMKKSFQTPNNAGVAIEVIVPHPSLRDSARYNLIEKYADLEPPKLKPTFSEMRTVAGRKAEYRELERTMEKPAICSLYFKLDHEVRVVMYSTCKNVEAMESVANLLSFDRLEGQLNS